MPALRLFVSHSSRLDDVPHRYTDDDANWCLLRATCDGLQARYGDAIRLLVDRDGLIPGDDWNLELNLWLAECQAAVILVSRRALERYLQRAWPGTHPRCVPVGAARTAAQVQAEIRRRVLGEGLPPMLTATQLDRQVNREPTAIVVIVCAADDGGGLPDPRLCAEVEQFTDVYDKLVLVFASATPLAALPETLRLITPPLDPQTEGDAFLAERAATTDLHQRYGRHHELQPQAF